MTAKEQAFGGPFTNVTVTRHTESGNEVLVSGSVEESSFVRVYDGKSGDERFERFVVSEELCLPREMHADELLSWLRTAPESVDAHLQNDLSEEFGDSIGVTEFQPTNTVATHD